MVNKIFKYDLSITDSQFIELPINSEILDFQFQDEELKMWAIVNPDLTEMQKRKIRIIGTGHSFYNYQLQYLKTVQHMNGQLVWHIFEDQA